MMEVPGKVGWPIIGDKSVEFYRDPLNFLKSNTDKYESKIFAARFLNKPTVFVCSHQGVKDVLMDVEDAFELGYETFMGPMFGKNILFSNNEEARHLRESLGLLLTAGCLKNCEKTIQRTVTRQMSSMSTDQPVCLYEIFKKMFTEICLNLFLGLDLSESKELAETITALTTAHWRGIVAVPLDLKIPGFGTSSTYSKALEAKAKLLEVINDQRQKASSGFPSLMKPGPSMDETAINNHLLLFTSALVPKVLASICTALCIEIGGPESIHLQTQANENPTFLDGLLLETKRLHPPLLGGRRVARKSCTIAGYTIPKDYAVVFMSHPAQRDPVVFQQPDTFMPERWAQNVKLKENLFVYGMGPRACIGQDLSWLILKKTVEAFVSKFSWKICKDQDFTHKRIPVSRPKCNLLAKLTPR